MSPITDHRSPITDHRRLPAQHSRSISGCHILGDSERLRRHQRGRRHQRWCGVTRTCSSG